MTDMCRFTCSGCNKMRTESSYHNGVCSFCRKRSKREDDEKPFNLKRPSEKCLEELRRCGTLNIVETQ